MSLRGFVLVLALLVPSAAMADPISVGDLWLPSSTSTSGDPTLQTVDFLSSWPGLSWDGPFLLNSRGGDYLTSPYDGTGDYPSLQFDNEILTASTVGVFGRSGNGALTNHSGTGLVSDVWTHHIVYVGSDILIPEVLNHKAHGVPEPATLLLLCSGMAAVAARKKLAARKARAHASV